MKLKKNHLSKKLTLLFIFTIIIQIFTSSIQAENTNGLAQYNEELERVKQQEHENAQKLTGVEREIAEYLYEIADLDSQMAKYQGELSTLNKKVDTTNNTIKKHESSLQSSSQLYNSAEELYRTRLRVIYENGIPSAWDILFSSKGISDFFSKMNIYDSVLEYDKSLVSNMQSQKEYIDYIKRDLEIQKLQLEQLKYDVQKSTNALNDTLTAKQNKVKDLENSKGDLMLASQTLAKKREQALKDIDDEIARILASQNTGGSGGGSTSFPGGDFEWPVPGFLRITTRFGEIYNLVNPAGSAHTGADIAGAGIHGTPIVAAAAGQITTAKYTNYGYGNYIIINHGTSSVDNKNYISLYGHQSALAVKVGDYVTKGQVIGYVGSTGNSTGAHLHFEIRINGKLSDPLVQYPGIQFKY